MTWPIAIFACFSVLIVSVLAFLLIIYLKEYSREEKLLKQFSKASSLEKDLSNIPVYIMPLPPKKSVSAPTEKKTIKNKKDVN